MSVKNNHEKDGDPEFKIKASESDDNRLEEIERIKNFLGRTYEFRYNIVANLIECRRKNFGNSTKALPFEELDENPLLYFILSHGYKCDATKLGIVLSQLVERYDPFIEYLESLAPFNPKDDADYIGNLSTYFKAISEHDMDVQISFAIHLKKHIVRAVACAIDEEYINKHCLVLIGKQHDGKSYFCRWLCPPALKDYMAENISIDKDSLIAICENMYINLDELATIHKTELNSLKSVFSKADIKVRPPYGRRAIRMKRRATFLGNTNSAQFLSDPTGSVRWLSFELESIDHAYSKQIKIDDVYRQAYYLYRNARKLRYNYSLTPEEINDNEKRNNRHFMTTPEMELIDKYFEPSDKLNGQFMTSTEILNYIMTRIVLRNLTSKGIGMAMQKLGFKNDTGGYKEKGFNVWGYYVNEKHPSAVI